MLLVRFGSKTTLTEFGSVRSPYRFEFGPSSVLVSSLFSCTLSRQARNQTYPKGGSYSSPLPLSSLPPSPTLPIPSLFLPIPAPSPLPYPPFPLEVGPLKSS